MEGRSRVWRDVCTRLHISIIAVQDEWYRVGFSALLGLGLPCFCQMLSLGFAPICRLKKRLERQLVVKVCFLGRNDPCPVGE